MLYAIIDTRKGESAGLRAVTHCLLQGGSRMIVNENELRWIGGEDIAAEAALLGGVLMTLDEVKEAQRREKERDKK